MSVSGLCQICERRAAEFSCPRCGSVVCEVHFDTDRGVCTACTADLGDGI